MRRCLETPEGIKCAEVHVAARTGLRFWGPSLEGLGPGRLRGEICITLRPLMRVEAVLAHDLFVHPIINHPQQFVANCRHLHSVDSPWFVPTS